MDKASEAMDLLDLGFLSRNRQSGAIDLSESQHYISPLSNFCAPLKFFESISSILKKCLPSSYRARGYL